MSDRSIRIAAILMLIVTCGFLAAILENQARSQRAVAAAQASRARLQELMERQQREVLELRGMMEKLEESIEAERVQRGRHRGRARIDCDED